MLGGGDAEGVAVEADFGEGGGFVEGADVGFEVLGGGEFEGSVGEGEGERGHGGLLSRYA